MSEPYEAWRDLELLQPTDAQLWLLGVTDQDLLYRDSLMQVTTHMVSSALRTPHGSGYYERMSRPYVGDLVMEYTRGWWSKDIRVRAWSFGVLVAFRSEYWASVSNGQSPAGETYYIRWGRGKDDVQRWENARFVLVPVERDNFGV